jgi:hypothetical protein
VNLVLLTAIALTVAAPKTAFAQQAPLSDNFLIITAEIQTGNDGIFLLDQQSRFLHVFYTQRATNDRVVMRLAGSRNLEVDFRNEEGTRTER